MKTHRRVRFSETDASGRVHFTTILKWAEEAEHDLLQEAGLTVFETSAPDSGWPRVKVSCDYRAPLTFGQDVEITMVLAEIGGRSLTWRFTVREKGSDSPIAAQGEIVTAFLQGGEPTTISDEHRRRLESYTQKK